MSVTNHRQLRYRFARLGPALLIAGLVTWHAIYNWHWLQRNVVITGWDKARHLAQSLAYNNMLSPLTLRTLFNALISDQVRPPLAPMMAVILYRLFGVSGDVAIMINVFYLALTLVVTWQIGVRLQGQRLGVLSVLLLALLPMFYAMSRYFYIEFPLMAMVTLTIYLLLVSDGFRRRGTTLLFGLCLGLGLLTKRTYAVFVFAPVGLMVLRSEVLSGFWQRLRCGRHIDLKDVILALGGGLALAAVWVFPNWATVQKLALGGWLYPLWAGLVAVTIYLIRRRPAPDVNFLTALALGATLGSVWYLANISFVQRVLLFGYGVDDPRGRTIDLRQLSTYTDYLIRLVNEHLSVFISLILAAAALLLAFVWLRRGQLGASLRRIGIGWWVVLLWLLGPYLVLTFSIYHETRAITPVLPAIALLGGGLLVKLPWKKTAALLLVALIVGGLLQFYAISFEPLHALVQATSLRLPLLGQTGLLARGEYLQLPDSGVTDHRFWIEPDVLQRIEQARRTQQWDAASMGLLVNDRQINFEHFAYLTLAHGYWPRITVERLARAKGQDPVYPRLFRNDYLLVKRNNAAVDADSQVVIDRILDDPPSLFQLAFDLDKAYALPDGDTAFLFRRRERPPDGVTAAFFPDLARALVSMARETDAVVVSPRHLVPLLGQDFEGDLDVYALSGGAPVAKGQTPEGTAEVAVAQVAAEHGRILAVFGEGSGGDLDQAGRDWLNEHGYRAWDAWFGPTQLVVYGTADETEPLSIQPVGAALGENVRLLGYSLHEERLPSTGVLPLTLIWQAQGRIDQSYKVFVHLVDDKGQLVAQRDSEPGGGSKPTTAWAVGETITDRVGVLLPADTPPGEYQLRVGMYDPATMERLPVLDAEGQPLGDTIPLATVRVPALSQ